MEAHPAAGKKGLHAYKGVGVYLRSLKEINGGKGFQPILAGRFKNNDERDALLREAELPEELARRVVCTGGVSNAELRALYGRCNGTAGNRF